MAFTITKILLVALYIVTCANSLPTIAGEVSSCGKQEVTDGTSIYLDCSGLSSDAIASPDANASFIADPLTMAVCFPDESCCGTIQNCFQVSRCFDNERCSGPSGCDIPGRSAAATSSFTCAPMQTCATSVIASGASTNSLTFSCFDIRTKVAAVVAPSVASVTPMPRVDHIPVLEQPDSAVYSVWESAFTIMVSSTKNSHGVGTDDPYGAAITEILFSNAAEDSPSATDLTLSLTKPVAAIMTVTQDTSTPFSTWTTSLQTSVPASPTSTNSTSALGGQAQSRTPIVVGGLFGSLAFMAISITLVDYLLKRRKYIRCRRSSSGTSTDDDATAHNKDEQQQMTAYGYYGTNRAGIINKGSGVLEANADPVELAAEASAEHRE